MAIVCFDPKEFKLAYPDFSDVSDARLMGLFYLAESTLLDNTDNSPVMNTQLRSMLFELLVAHLLLLFGISDTQGAGQQPNNRPPGRIASATQGTITTAFDYDIPKGSAMAAWYQQTKYGAMYWMATAPYRSARYIASGSSGIGRAKAYGVPPVYRPGGV